MSFIRQRQVNGKATRNDVAILCCVTLVVLLPVFVLSYDRSYLRKWFPEPPAPLILAGNTGWVLRATFSPDNKMVACLDDKQVSLWDTKTGFLLRAFPLGHTPGALGLLSTTFSPAFSPDGTLLAFVDTRNFQGRKGSEKVEEVKLWDVRTGALQRVLQGHGPQRISPKYVPQASQLTFSTDGKTLATVFSDKSHSNVKLWDVRTGALRRTWNRPVEKAHSITFSPDGKTLAIGGEPNKLRLWDVKTGQLLRTLNSPIDSVMLIFTPDGKSLRNSGAMSPDFLEAGVETWDVKTGRLRTTLRGFQHYVALAANGKMMAARPMSSPKDRHAVQPICLFEAETGKLVQTLSGRQPGANVRGLSPDGTTVLSFHAVGFLPNGGPIIEGNLWRYEKSR